MTSHSHMQEEASVKDYLAVLGRRRDIVIAFFITTVLVVTIGSFLMKPVYRATATLLIDVESPNVLTTSGTVALESQNYFTYKEYYQSQKEIISSYSIARKVFNEFGLKDLQEYIKAKEPVKKFIKTIVVEPVRDTRLLRLNVESKDPLLAGAIANRIAEIYVTRNLYYISKTEILNLLKNEYLKLETKLSEYSKIYKEGHPEMIRLRKEMAEMVGKIENEKKSASAYDMADGDLKNKYQQALEGLKANNVSIQDPAEKPVVPVRPKKLLNIIIGVIAGLFGGVALGFFFEYLDDTVKTVEDIERAAEWPFLGGIPDINIDGGPSKEIEKDLFVLKNPSNPVAESYRSIRTRISFSSTEEHPAKVLLITSPGPQEGKTTTLCNLGIVMAQNQKKVLMVDGDMRRPRLHEVFQKENKTGFSNLLAGQASFGDVVQKTGVENIWLVSGGEIPPNPSELLSAKKTRDFLAKAKGDFDFVLVDSPPIGMLTDAAIISGLVDGTLMVIESGKTSKRVLSRIYRLLAAAKARVIGMILNRSSDTSNSYYYYSYYYGKEKAAKD